MRRLAALLLAGAGLAAPVLGQPAALEADTEVSDTGYFNLSWADPGEGRTVTVEQSLSGDFSDARTIYEGPDEATVVSGLFDGTYHYRIRVDRGPWSEPVAVTVRHHSLAQAFSFLAMGAVVFLATAALILGGHRHHRREQAARAAQEGGDPA